MTSNAGDFSINRRVSMKVLVYPFTTAESLTGCCLYKLASMWDLSTYLFILAFDEFVHPALERQQGGMYRLHFTFSPYMSRRVVYVSLCIFKSINMLKK